MGASSGLDFMIDYVEPGGTDAGIGLFQEQRCSAPRQPDILDACTWEQVDERRQLRIEGAAHLGLLRGWWIGQSEAGSGLAPLTARTVSPIERDPSPAFVHRSSMPRSSSL